MAFRRISDLSSSLSPSGDGIIPISEGGKTYGLTLDTIKGQIEGVLTSSFTDSSSHEELSSSVDDNSTSIDSLNQFTSSADGRLNSIETFTGSLDNTFATDLELRGVQNIFNSYTSSANNILQDHELQRWLHGERLTSIETFTGSLSNTVNDIINIEGRLDSIEVESGSIRSDFNSFTSSFLLISQSFDQRISFLETHEHPTATPVPTVEPTPTPVPDPTATPVPDPTPTPVPDPTATPVPDPTPTLPPGPTPTATVEPTATPVPTVEYELYTAYLNRDEGQSAFFELQWTNGTSGTTVGFTLSGTATPALEMGGMIEAMDYTEPTDMFFTVDNNGSVILEIPINEDSQTEGTETIILTLDAQDSNGNPTGGLQKTVTINDTSELQNWEIAASTHDEGITFNHILNTEHAPAGTEYFWYVSVGIGFPYSPASAADFVGGVVPSGSGTIPAYNETLSQSAVIPISIVADSLTEGDEVYQIIVKEGSPSNPGTLREITMMTITDSSLTPVTTPTPTPTPLPVDFTIRFQLDGGNSTYSLKDLSIPQSFGNTHNHTITGYDHDGFETVTTNVVANNGYTFNGNDGELTYAINGSPISNNQGNSTQNTNGFFTTYNSVTDSWDLSIQIGSVGSDLITEGEIIILTISGNAISDPTPTPTPTVEPDPTPTPTVDPTSTPLPNPTPTQPNEDLQDIYLTLYINNDGGVNPWSGNSTYDDVQNHLCTYGATSTNGTTRQTDGDPNNPQTGDRFYAGGFPLEPFGRKFLKYYPDTTQVSNWKWIDVDNSGYISVSGFTCSTPTPTPTVEPTSTPVPDPTATVEPTSTPVPNPTNTPVPDPTATVEPTPTSTEVPLQNILMVTTINSLPNPIYNTLTGNFSGTQQFLCNNTITSASQQYRQTSGDPTNPQNGDMLYHNGSLAINTQFGFFWNQWNDVSDKSSWRWVTTDSNGVMTVSQFNCPTSTPVPNPTATVEPTPTETVAPTSTPVPNPTSTPVPNPTATPVPDPTDTPVPTSTEVPTPTPTVEPTATPVSCISAAPLNINVESEYDSNTNTTVFKYITSDSDGNGGLFGCINVNRGSTVTISVTGSAPNLESHPIKITNFNDQGQHESSLPNVVSTWNAGSPYTLTWEVPCDMGITQYQYQCVNHASMRGVINVSGTCPTPTPTDTPTPTSTETPTPTDTPTPTSTETPTPTVTPTPTSTPTIVDCYVAGPLITDSSNGAVFDRSVNVSGMLEVIAGAVGGQVAVPDEFSKKVARSFQLIMDPSATGITLSYQNNLVATLRGDEGTTHEGLPTAQRIGYGSGDNYDPNWLTDEGITGYTGYEEFLDTHAVNDMIWYQSGSTSGDAVISEVFEHIFHTVHLFGIMGAVPGSSTAVNWMAGENPNWQTTELHLSMKQAIENGMYDPTDYAPNWNTDTGQAQVAYKEYMYLLNFGMWEMSEFWDGGSLSPEWNDNMRTPSGIQTNNILGYTLFNDYFTPVLTKPSFTTLRNIFQNNGGGSSGYVADDCITPTPTPTVDPVPKLDPTPIPTSTPNPTPTSTVEPTATPVPSTPTPTVSLTCLDGDNDNTVMYSEINFGQGNFYIFNGSYEKYHTNTGTYVLKNVSIGHPITVLNSGKESLIYVDGIHSGTKIGSDGNSYSYYYGDVTITVQGNYGTVSYECYYHGYMGGQDNLVFSNTCDSSNPAPTATVEPTPTPTDTPTPTSTETPVPSPTETPIPTSTETPTPTSTEIPTPNPTNTPNPTPTPTVPPSQTPQPTPTSTVEISPTPTITVVPTNTPLPNPTPTPTAQANSVYVHIP